MVPQTIGHYRILEEIGAGGMGSVYRAQHTTLSSRVVAIKLLSSSVIYQPRIRERFLREAEIMATLNHENIVMLHDFLVVDGHYAIVMELIDGVTLDRHAGSEPMPFAVAAPLFRQVLSALGYAHRHGVIHRDVKPSNVLVTPDRRVKVTDFGIARLAGDSQLTQTGLSLGTPRYMSPEQIEGTREITAASDIYGCGILFYRVLTGRVPFEATEAKSFSILQAHVTIPPPPLRNLAPAVPEAVEACVLRALAKNPDARWPSCEAFAEALGFRVSESTQPLPWLPETTRIPAALAGPAADDATRYDAARTSSVRRGPRLVAWATAAALGLAVVAGTKWFVLQRAEVPSGGPGAMPVPSAASEARPAVEDAGRAPPPDPAVAAARSGEAASSATPPNAPALATDGPASRRVAAPSAPVDASGLIEARAFLRADQPAEALKALVPVMEADPTDPGALALRRQANAALAADRKRVHLRATSLRGEAASYLEKGKVDLAIATVKESLALEPGDREARALLARAEDQKLKDREAWQSGGKSDVQRVEEAKP